MTTLTFTRKQFAKDATALRRWNRALTAYLSVKGYDWDKITVSVDQNGVIVMNHNGPLDMEQHDDIKKQMETLVEHKVVKPGFSSAEKYEFVYLDLVVPLLIVEE